MKEVAMLFRHSRIELLDNEFFCFFLILLAKSCHGIRLGIMEELKKQFPIHGKGTVIVRILPDDIAVFYQFIHNEMLVRFFGKDIIHDKAPPFCLSHTRKSKTFCTP